MFVHNTKTQTYWFNGVSHDFDEFKLIGTVSTYVNCASGAKHGL